MGPNNGIIGDETGVELPSVTLSEDFLSEEKKMAKYSRSAEYKKIVAHFEERIAFYQGFLPDGRDIKEGVIPTPEQWIIANALITEFKWVMNLFERSAEAVKEANE